MTYDLVGKPSSLPVGSDCGEGIVEEKEGSGKVSI